MQYRTGSIMRAPAQIWKKYKSTCLYVNYLKERWQVGGRGEAGITWRVLNKEHVKTGIDIHVNILEQKLRWDHRVRRVSHEKGLWGMGRAESLAWNNHLSVTATQTTLTETQPPSLHALVQVENTDKFSNIFLPEDLPPSVIWAVLFHAHLLQAPSL